MKKPKKDRSGKRYVPRDPLDTKLKHEPWRLVGVFATPLEIIDRLEQHGAVLVENNIPVFRDVNDGKLYEVLPALAGFIDLFEIYNERYANKVDLDPLRTLYRLLADEEAAISSDDTRAVRTTIEALRRAMFELTRGQADELVQDFKLREALQGNIVD